MKAVLQRILSGRFGRNVAWMTGATILGHGLFLLASPILTRIYSPEAFAQLVILMTLQALLLAGMSGRIERSVPVATHPIRAEALVTAALVTLTVTTLILTCALSYWQDQFLEFFELPPEIGLLLLIAIPLSVLASGVQMVLHSWCVSCGQLRPIAVTKVVQSAVFLGVALVAGAISGVGLWLATGFAISHVVAGALLVALLVTMIRKLFRLRLNYVWSVVRHSWSEIAASLGSSLLHSLAFYLPFLMIWAWYDDVILGLFGFVFRIGTAPLSFLSAALAKSFWAEAADLARHDPVRLRRFFVRTIGVLSLVAIPLVLFCLMAPFIFGPIFGAEWADAGTIMAALSPMLVALLVFSSTNHLIVYRRQHWQMYCDALSVMLFGGVFWALAAAGHGVALTLALSSLAFLASYGLRFGLHLRANRLWTQEMFR